MCFKSFFKYLFLFRKETNIKFIIFTPFNSVIKLDVYGLNSSELSMSRTHTKNISSNSPIKQDNYSFQVHKNHQIKRTEMSFVFRRAFSDDIPFRNNHWVCHFPPCFRIYSVRGTYNYPQWSRMCSITTVRCSLFVPCFNISLKSTFWSKKLYMG